VGGWMRVSWLEEKLGLVFLRLAVDRTAGSLQAEIFMAERKKFK
jgi:hypothetical protein